MEGLSRPPSYGLEALGRLRAAARRLTLAVLLTSLGIAVAMFALYGVYGDRGFLLAGVLMLAVTLVDSLILKAMLLHSADAARRLVEELARVVEGPYALAGGGLRGLTFSAKVGDGVLLAVVSGSKADLVFLRNPSLVDQRPLGSLGKAGVRVGEEGLLGALARELRSSSIASCRKQEYEGELTVTGPHPETPLLATWRGPGRVVRIRCPHAIDPRRLVSEVSLLLARESW